MGKAVTPAQIRKMPLTEIKLAPEVARFQDEFFRDIIERHATSGNIHEMLREAYVLGMRHYQIGETAQ